MLMTFIANIENCKQFKSFLSLEIKKGKQKKRIEIRKGWNLIWYEVKSEKKVK